MPPEQDERATRQAEQLYHKMCEIRAVEETLLALFAEGELSGTVHTSIGQEAIAAAVGIHLRADDVVFSNHRCHGHFLASGGNAEELIGEVMGRASGVCGGHGGSQHIHKGRFFSNGVQGGIVGNAVGAALAQRQTKTDHIVLVFLGDGTLGEGLVYESLNFASLRSLPILFVLENNRYAQTTPVELGVSGSIIGRAQAFGIEAAEIESNDVLELVETFEKSFAFVRQQGRPFFQVIHTYRLMAHSKGDDFRDPAEIASWRCKDPVALLASKMDASVAETCQRRARKTVDEATARARKSPPAPSYSSRIVSGLGGESFPVPFAAEACLFSKSLNQALDELLAEASTLVLGEDLLDPYGGAFGITRGLSTKYPDQVITTPISEAGIVAWATGAALMGLRPIAEIMFGDFLALAADQLLNHASKYPLMYNQPVRVPAVIRTPMGGRRGYGPTHSQSIEKMFLGIPGLTVTAPSHLLDPGELLKRCVQTAVGPVLFIENKMLYSTKLEPIREGRLDDFFVRATESCFPTLHLSLADFEAPDVALLCYGGSAPLGMESARRLLLDHEIVADVVVPSLLAPLPRSDLMNFVRRARAIATIEEGGKASGWGSEVIAALGEEGVLAGKGLYRFGAVEAPIPSARHLEAEALPDVDSIVQKLARALL